MDTTLRIGVGISTAGRASILDQVVQDIVRQTRLPDRLLISHAADSDVGRLDVSKAQQMTEICVKKSAAGLPRQRNVILDAVSDLDVLLFIDDDFLMAPRYLEAVAAAFEDNSDVVATTGTLIHDDVKGPGLSVVTGLAKIDADCANRDDLLDRGWEAAPHGYGCNMAFRLATVRAHGLRFDERLPLYGWSEDIDFTHRIARHGVIAKLAGARGVHLGVKQGRSSGRRLGYSQVANPVYLLRKGSYSTARAGRSVARNIAANLARALWPEPYIDRRGRLLGNGLALLDMCRGRMQPERILEL
jgi:GT2 family glycosyltransferase